MFNNKAILAQSRQDIIKGNIDHQFSHSEALQQEIVLNDEQFQKAVTDFNLEVYSYEQILRFRNDLTKGVVSDTLSSEALQKARKDLSRLIKTTVIDKNGDKRTVYVARQEVKPSKGYASHTKDEAEIHATIKRQESLLANPKSPASAKKRAQEIIETERAKLPKNTEQQTPYHTAKKASDLAIKSKDPKNHEKAAAEAQKAINHAIREKSDSNVREFKRLRDYHQNAAGGPTSEAADAKLDTGKTSDLARLAQDKKTAVKNYNDKPNSANLEALNKVERALGETITKEDVASKKSNVDHDKIVSEASAKAMKSGKMEDHKEAAEKAQQALDSLPKLGDRSIADKFRKIRNSHFDVISPIPKEVTQEEHARMHDQAEEAWNASKAAQRSDSKSDHEKAHILHKKAYENYKAAGSDYKAEANAHSQSAETHRKKTEGTKSSSTPTQQKSEPAKEEPDRAASKEEFIQHPVYGKVPKQNNINDNWTDKIVAKYFSLGKEEEMTQRADGIYDADGKLAAKDLKDLKKKWNWPGASIRYNPDIKEVESKRPKKIYAHGFKGEHGDPWKKTFKSVDEMNKWAKQNEADIHDHEER